MIQIPQSTSFLCVFKAYLASDHVTEATGKTIAITISKNGGAFGNLNAGATNATEISSGWYKVTLDTTDTGTLGTIAIRGAVATVDDVGVWVQVVSATTGGITNLDAAITSRMATYTQPTGFLSATFPTGTVANTTNITAGVVTTATNVTTVNGLAANVITATSIAADAITAAKIADGAIDAATFAAGAIDATAIAANAIGASELATDAVTEIADGILARDIGSGSNAGSSQERTVRSALRFLRNKWAISGTTLTVNAEDDSTAMWTSTVTPTAGANPITANDPT